MKKTLVMLALMIATSSSAFALDTLEIKETTTPALCAVPGAPVPMPCAFAIAMMQKVMSMCSGGGCNSGCGGNGETCPVRTPLGI